MEGGGGGGFNVNETIERLNVGRVYEQRKTKFRYQNLGYIKQYF